jgi:hypothetical protein
LAINWRPLQFNRPGEDPFPFRGMREVRPVREKKKKKRKKKMHGCFILMCFYLK